jgi:hypothetical protein
VWIRRAGDSSLLRRLNLAAENLLADLVDRGRVEEVAS